ncbi:ABC transporter ATP-binding protein [Paenibacillus sp. RC67]|uniref:ABC transporter ATP-binding protein n=1 Tax=Paenibacillus sp. RC67 TaxID=3039392 RepID=UPI0024AD0218|nr:ABC transporter ATP-binding protein [Paenibacillus sp. RC67]
MEALLKIDDLQISFGKQENQVRVVNRINFQILPGEIVGIVGESGCGKSVTSMSVLRLLGKQARIEGKIVFQGKDLLKLSEKEMRAIRGNDISMIFQEPMTSLNPLQSIGYQLAEPLKKHKRLSASGARKQSIQLLKEVGIPRAEEIVDEFPHQLSGGMRQRVMIAMAMACNPRLIIADEPTTALDVTIQAQILKLMKTISERHQSSILFITHDLGVVAEICDRVIVMYAGEIVEQADVKTLFEAPKHPYTIGLMNSIPDMDSSRVRLQPIPGNVPSVRQMPEGCRFAPRCDKASDICKKEPPAKWQDNHYSKCWLHAEV